MNTHFVKFSLLTTVSLLAISYTPGISCQSEQKKVDKAKEADTPKIDDGDSVDTLDDIFVQMHKNFAKMQQQMEEDFKIATNRLSTAANKTPMSSLSITSNDNALTIKLSNVTGENIEATTRDNEQLMVKTAEVTLELTVRDNVLHAQITQEQKKEEKDGAKSHFSSLNYAESYQTIFNELDLDSAKVQFEEKNKSLVITIHFLPEKTGKKLAVEKITAPQPAPEK